ncbi:MAG TPA: redoxin domain-containing protein [Anaerolineales bacterium]|nr:redoxin domain-containing protein [Anaerolineales bacterium]
MNLAHGLLLSLIILIAGGCSAAVTLEPGSTAPEFALHAVRGGEYRTADLTGQPILLSFINTQAEASSATADPSRAQIVFLKSMQEQYGPKGLVVWIVDAARIATGKRPSQDHLINFTYDWQLDDIPVLDDTDSSVARSYVVESTPVTFLIGADKVIQQRWDGFASASQLALSIEALVGAPAHRPADTAEGPATLPAATCPNEVQPQAKFAGVGLARPLSEALWVVDGGGSWGTGADFPVQWILIDTRNLTQQAPVHIKVLGQYTEDQQIITLTDQSMELLATDVANGLLSGNVTPPTMYSLVTTVLLERPGCMRIWAVVTRDDSTVPLYQGSLDVSVR